ncbi:hypothetical protein RvY_00995, partial [Ramazzottius varieornatus]
MHKSCALYQKPHRIQAPISWYNFWITTLPSKYSCNCDTDRNSVCNITTSEPSDKIQIIYSSHTFGFR